MPAGLLKRLIKIVTDLQEDLADCSGDVLFCFAATNGQI